MCPWLTSSCWSLLWGPHSILRALLHPSPGKQAGPNLAPCPPSGRSHAFLPGSSRAPPGAQHVSLDFIRIKEMSHICKQAVLSQSSPAAVGRRRRWRKPCVAPCSGRTGSFIIVASASLQGRARANKWLAGSQKETIWPTRRTYLHL